MTTQITPQFMPSATPVEPVQLVGVDGNLLPGAQPALSEPEVLEALRYMMIARAFDTKCWSLQRQGKINTFAPVVGQEGAVTGSSMALDPARDWIVPQYRELPAQLRHGISGESLILYRQGHPHGSVIPDGVKVMPYQVSLAAQLPHAVGIGWGLKLQEKPGVAVVYFGDGASSEGDFHESCNFAAAFAIPVIFFLQNNQWAISTSRAQQSATADLASRAPGYGMPGVSVDGNDLLAVHKVMQAAVDRALAGGGPTLIEAHTFRLWAHTTADDPTRYVDSEVKEQWQQRDAIERVQRYLSHLGAWDDGAQNKMNKAVQDYIEDVFAKAAAHPPPRPEEVYEHVYAEPTSGLLRQQRWNFED
jgi:pyruvate dehydrogenase E1 component alpha subunit